MSFRKVFLYDIGDDIPQSESIDDKLKISTQKFKPDTIEITRPITDNVSLKTNQKLDEKPISVRKNKEISKSDSINIDGKFFKFIEDIVKRYINLKLEKVVKNKCKTNRKKKEIKVTKKSDKKKTKNKKSKVIKPLKSFNWIYDGKNFR